MRISPHGLAFRGWLVGVALQLLFADYRMVGESNHRNPNGQLFRRHRVDREILNFGGGAGRLFGFPRATAAILNGEKTWLRRQLYCLGLGGRFPGPDNGAILSANLTDGDKFLRADRLGEFLRIGYIARKELETITGCLSFSETSAFGRFGRGGAQPLYREQDADC